MGLVPDTRELALLLLCIQRKDHVGIQWEGGHLEASDSSPEPKPAGTLISYSQLPELGENTFLLLKLHGSQLKKCRSTKCTGGRRACENPSLLFVGEDDAKRKSCNRD